MEIGIIVRIINDKPFPGKKIGPPIEKGQEYPIKDIYWEVSKGDSPNYLHLDLGLLSEYNFITSQDTGEELPNGDRIHWVHPSRVEVV